MGRFFTTQPNPTRRDWWTNPTRCDPTNPTIGKSSQKYKYLRNVASYMATNVCLYCLYNNNLTKYSTNSLLSLHFRLYNKLKHYSNCSFFKFSGCSGWRFKPNPTQPTGWVRVFAGYPWPMDNVKGSNVHLYYEIATSLIMPHCKEVHS